MATPAKAADNLRRNMSQAEREAREQAESELAPARESITLEPPPGVRGDTRARRYWESILRRAEGMRLLDDLDAEMLGAYCTMLARRDALSALLRRGISEARKGKLTTDERIAALDKVDSLNGKVLSMERNILQYADKLGLTPSGRIRLARQRAENLVRDGDEDLFG